MDIVFSKTALEFEKAGHPESPERLEKASDYLKNKGYNFIEAEAAAAEELSLVHNKSQLIKIKENNFYNSDCPNYENIYDYAALAAGAALQAASCNGFSLMRPPGHHAGADYLMGFCYFNNLAVAVEKEEKKTLIIDFDGHHGNGTQDIFFGIKDIVYLSLHKAVFPGSGLQSRANCLNHVFRKIPGEEKYLKELQKLLQKALRAGVDFELIAVSAGFDAYQNDPLASLGISSEGYYKIGQLIAELGLPSFAVLEGGYNAAMLGKNIDNFITGLEA